MQASGGDLDAAERAASMDQPYGAGELASAFEVARGGLHLTLGSANLELDPVELGRHREIGVDHHQHLGQRRRAAKRERHKEDRRAAESHVRAEPITPASERRPPERVDEGVRPMCVAQRPTLFAQFLCRFRAEPPEVEMGANRARVRRVFIALTVFVLLGLWLAWNTRARWLRAIRLLGGRVDPRYPVVLLHGMFGFTELELGPRKHEYFQNICGPLEELGVQVHRPQLPALGSVRARATRLAEYVRDLDAPRVNIVAHSMGGLDARYAIARLGIARRVAAVITIGTPHRGTPVADVTSSIGDKLGMRRLLRALGLSVDGVGDVTTQHMQDFNREIEDVRGVWYGSVVGRAETAKDVHPLLRPTHKLLSTTAGQSDGMVPTKSQQWGELIARVEADHLAQIGWSPAYDGPALYVDLMRELRARGF